jgi:hypothetical protein
MAEAVSVEAVGAGEATDEPLLYQCVHGVKVAKIVLQ